MAPCSYPALPFQSAIGVESLSCPPIASIKPKWIPGLGSQSSGIAEIISSQIDALGENENRTPGLRLGGQELVIGPNGFLKRTLVGIAVSFLWLANVVYASNGGSSPGGTGLPDMVQYPLTVLHGSLYVGARLKGQPQPSWWSVDTGSPWSFVNAEQARRLSQSNPGIEEQIARMGGRTLPVLKGIEINIAGQSVGPFDSGSTTKALRTGSRCTANIEIERAC
jgi:hypothetical protein